MVFLPVRNAVAKHGAEQYAGYLETIFYGHHLDRAIPRISEAIYCLTPSLVNCFECTTASSIQREYHFYVLGKDTSRGFVSELDTQETLLTVHYCLIPVAHQLNEFFLGLVLMQK